MIEMKRRKRKSTEKFPFALNWQALISIKICLLMNTTASTFSFIPFFPGEAFIFTTQFSIKQSLLSHITHTTSIIQYSCVCFLVYIIQYFMYVSFFVFISLYLSLAFPTHCCQLYLCSEFMSWKWTLYLCHTLLFI